MDPITAAASMIRNFSKDLIPIPPLFKQNAAHIGFWEGICYNLEGQLYSVMVKGNEQTARDYTDNVKVACRVLLPNAVDIPETVRAAVNQLASGLPSELKQPWNDLEARTRQVREAFLPDIGIPKDITSFLFGQEPDDSAINAGIGLKDADSNLHIHLDFLGIASIAQGIDQLRQDIQRIVDMSGTEDLIRNIQALPGFQDGAQLIGTQGYTFHSIVDPPIHGRRLHTYDLPGIGPVTVNVTKMLLNNTPVNAEGTGTIVMSILNGGANPSSNTTSTFTTLTAKSQGGQVNIQNADGEDFSIYELVTTQAIIGFEEPEPL